MSKGKRGKRSARRKKKPTTWVGAALPVGLDADLVVWVDRNSGETIASCLSRPSATVRSLAQLYRDAAAETAPDKLCVGSHRSAEELRAAIGGIPVGFQYDRKSLDAIDEAAALAEPPDDPVTLDLDGGETLYTLKVTLSHSSPPIWRRIRVAGDVSLGVLHAVLQAAMGWQDSHLHRFEIDGVRYGAGDEDEESASLPMEHDVTIEEALKPGLPAQYRYDFGDDWTHDIEVESVTTAHEGDPVATCLDGARACPPEDSGGIPGYEEKLRAAADRRSDEDHELAEWLGDEFDPEAFDRDGVNQTLTEMFTVESHYLGEGEYDAQVDPDPDLWLMMPENVRINAIQFYHQDHAPESMAKHPEVHVLIHLIVENQLALDEPAAVRPTFRRLQDEGLDRHQAIHAMGREAYRIVAETPREAGFDDDVYTTALEKLTADEYLRSSS